MISETQSQFVELTRSECLELLRSKEVGRLAVVVGGRPLIFPVNYVMDGDVVVFRNDPGTKLTNATLDMVAFQIDGLDRDRHEGWTVMVQGIALDITDGLDEASERQKQLDVRPWAPGAKAHWVRLVPHEISGRRLTHR